ncbi:RNA-binding protein S4 [Herbaspirillum sp. meg3]|uniref:RNA-binding S4 domain-containing protein n=1 Tax=Herbaspirillum sp. meg3 TaxID=2025949 RepID=UPI000B987DD9|nr:RNA-binding S4 domain-containing protein [Herbaspirillum sp. meg3]ASU40772.1 RNA-binding protein S4 [Herbaspirillum sp. meg3]
METTRIDKWLWAARFFKTRSLATDAVERGKVKFNGDRTKPSHNVKVGDTLLIDNGATEWEVVICGIAEKRGSAAVAQTLYGETAASVEKRRLTTEQHHFFREPASALKGRPTKRDRRLLDQSSS